MFIYLQNIRRKRRKDLNPILPLQGEPINRSVPCKLKKQNFLKNKQTNKKGKYFRDNMNIVNNRNSFK